MASAGEFEHVRIEHDDQGIYTLWLDRPPVNALGRKLVAEITAAARQLDDDDSVRVLLVRSAGKHFCAGADLKERKEMDVEDVREFDPRLAAACNALAALDFPVVAVVTGVAAGGGCELALACDLRIMTDDARIGLPETTLAILPGAGGTQRLATIAGMACAKRWILLGELHDAATAKADGVADWVVPSAGLEEEVRRVAGKLAANGPLAVRLAKQAIEEGWDAAVELGLAVEWECYQGVLDSEDRLEALAAFAEKRPPRFTGR